ncbi:MAG: HNH endonuclease [Gemmatimonadetes bacterium]|nr:HNH endonuclease [Gemmatimonadota bacterium]
MRGVGWRTRTIPPHIRRALEERDRGCRYPGYASRFTEAHHVKHWADGGETSLANTILLCRRHHRLVYEGRTRMAMDRDGKAAFFTRAGQVIASAPPLPEGAGAELPAPPAPPRGGMSNGAARFVDSEVALELELEAMEAVA